MAQKESEDRRLTVCREGSSWKLSPNHLTRIPTKDSDTHLIESLALPLKPEL